MLTAVFTALADNVAYDTTENFLRKTLFFSSDQYEEMLSRGLGLSCQEQYFLLRNVLRQFGRDSEIIHGDVLDRRTGLVKSLFATAVVVRERGGFWHIDPISRLMCFIASDSRFQVDHLGEQCSVTDSAGIYTCAWTDPAGDTEVTYYKQSDERARINRLRATYVNPHVVPFGVITPFYWQVGPTRKIFYDVFADKIRLIVGSSTHELDLLDWDMHESSGWLTDAQKARVFRCVSDIELNLDQYRDSMSRFLIPVANGQAGARAKA
jgi:hypothetical protein